MTNIHHWKLVCCEFNYREWLKQPVYGGLSLLQQGVQVSRCLRTAATAVPTHLLVNNNTVKIVQYRLTKLASHQFRRNNILTHPLDNHLYYRYIAHRAHGNRHYILALLSAADVLYKT